MVKGIDHPEPLIKALLRHGRGRCDGMMESAEMVIERYLSERRFSSPDNLAHTQNQTECAPQ